ncbi:MAG: GNAT family N-acetyltransferase [Saprospiraceae bacterium]|nr:GNAT family N-acetyltransferase [Saprospiraceae bacterium]
MTPWIQEAGVQDISKLIPVLKVLRPHLSDHDLFQLVPLLFEEGYRLIYMGDEENAYSAAGFRTMNFLFSGKTLYIDDLVTLPEHHKKGYASSLLNWLKTYAMENQYDHFSLDSGFQRKDAHRLYLSSGLEMEGFHIGKKLSSWK